MSSLTVPTTRPAGSVGRPAASAAAPAATTSASTIWRRRIVAVLALVLLAFVLTVAIGRVGAGADLDDPVAGHVVVAPGETLWDVAAATAPPGVDVRRQLADLEALNGVSSSEVAAWTVILIPAR
jgi:hypothetical protein